MAKRQSAMRDAGLPTTRANEVVRRMKKRRTRGWNDGSDDAGGHFEAHAKNGAAIHCDRSSLRSPMSTRECDDTPMHVDELAAFNSWIKKSADSPPVPMAGAAKRVPDEDLAMFRESRLVSSVPLDLPVADASPRREGGGGGGGAFLPRTTTTASRRPRSWESSGSKRKTMRSVERLVEEKLSFTTETLLPPLSSPTRKDAQIRDALLSEVKSSVGPQTGDSTAELCVYADECDC